MDVGLGFDPGLCRFDSDHPYQVTFLLNSSMQNRAENRKYHYIYKITRFDGKYYIGMHSTDNLDDGYFGSGKLITRSIKKHGIEKHRKEILEFVESRISLKERERELVNEEIINDPLCMNLKLGGSGGSHGKEAEIWARPGYKEKLAKSQSVGQLLKWSDAAHQEKMSKIRRDQWLSEEYRIKMADRTLSSGMLGKQHTEATRSKMSLSGRGEKNSQFGSCWVTDGVKPIKIKKDKLDEYLANGYCRGRS